MREPPCITHLPSHFNVCAISLYTHHARSSTRMRRMRGAPCMVTCADVCARRSEECVEVLAERRVQHVFLAHQVARRDRDRELLELVAVELQAYVLLDVEADEEDDAEGRHGDGWLHRAAAVARSGLWGWHRRNRDGCLHHVAAAARGLRSWRGQNGGGRLHRAAAIARGGLWGRRGWHGGGRLHRTAAVARSGLCGRHRRNRGGCLHHATAAARGLRVGVALDCREEEAQARTETGRYTNINFSKVALRRYARLASLAFVEQWNTDSPFEVLVREAIESELPGGK